MVFVLARKLDGIGEQRFRLLVDASGRLLGDDKPLHVLQDGIDTALVTREALLQLDQCGARLFVAYPGQSQRVAAFEQSIQDVAEGPGVLAKEEGDFGIDFVG